MQFPEQSTDEITRQITRAEVPKFTVDGQTTNPLVSLLLSLAAVRASSSVLVFVLLRQAQGGARPARVRQQDAQPVEATRR